MEDGFRPAFFLFLVHWSLVVGGGASWRIKVGEPVDVMTVDYLSIL
jgi:hypothetical protein